MSYIMLDAGGTNIKYGLLDNNAGLEGGMGECPSRSCGSSEEIFRTIAAVINEKAGECGKLDGIGFSFPGPFDYSNGISWMKGIGKYDSVFGLSIKEGIAPYLDSAVSKAVPMLFMHDVTAFAEGYAAVSEYRRLLALVIGTGAGSAFVENGKCVSVFPGLPINGWIYNEPFKDSIIDDYISARGLEKLAFSYFGKYLDGKTLSREAMAGNGKALEVFSAFGENIAAALKPYIDVFRPDGIVFAGQISKSLEFFISPLARICPELSIMTEDNTSLRIFQGLYGYFRRNL